MIYLLIGLTFFVVWFYGNIKYKEGERFGITEGVVVGTSALYRVLRERNLLGQDEHGNLFRVDDKGEKGATVVSFGEAPDMCRILKKLVMNPEMSIDTDKGSV